MGAIARCCGCWSISQPHVALFLDFFKVVSGLNLENIEHDPKTHIEFVAKREYENTIATMTCIFLLKWCLDEFQTNFFTCFLECEDNQFHT